MRRLVGLLGAASLAIAAIGCGSSGHAGAPVSLPHPQPSTSPTGGGKGNAVFVIKIPRPHRGAARLLGHVHKRYVSASTKSISIAANGGAPLIADVTPNSPGCTNGQNGPVTCTIAAPEPVGADTFVFVTYDQLGGAGNALSGATVQTTIVAGQANDVSVTLSGIVASLALALNPANPPQGNAMSIPLSVLALDADGNVIVPPGSYIDANGNPLTITLTDSDAAHTSLTQTTVTDPTQVVSVLYDGGPLVSALFTASTGSITTTGGQDAVLAPASGNPAPVPSTQSLATSGSGDVRTFSVSEPNYSGTFTAQSSDATIGAVTTQDGINFTVTGGPNAGTCTITVTDASGNAAAVYSANTVTNVSVD